MWPGFAASRCRPSGSSRARWPAEVGIATAAARKERHAHTLPANAETAFDANRFAEISPRVRGFLREVKADLGQKVRVGEVLAVVDSPEVSAAKTQYLAAKDAAELADVTYERTAELAKSGSVASKTAFEDLTALNQARARMMDAEQKLRNHGFSNPEIVRIAEERDTTSLLSIASPVDGTVVRRHAVQGEAVQPTSLLFAVSDTARMWLWIDVYEADIAKVELGRPVRFDVSDGDGPTFEGTVTWIGAEVDPKTRTTKVRVELANPSGHLRANQFGLARIQIGEEHEAILVPQNAVQQKDGVNLVFLSRGEGAYRPQRVQTTASGREDVVEIAWGLESGQEVVTTGSYLLKTEIMKGAIGAGCCD